jgi:hypothetical protein
MTTYVVRNGVLVEAQRGEARPRIHIISDTVAPTWHPETDVVTESKSVFRRMTKDSGCVEVGDFKPKPYEMPPVKESIAAAYQMLNQGFKPDIHTMPDSGDE